jgi:hypothetical protein
MFERGIISRTNKFAHALGVMPGQSCKSATEFMRSAMLVTFEPGDYNEARIVIAGNDGEADVVLIDSASLVKPDDAGRIIITGSHGGLVGGRPEMALQVDGLAGVFHDAGGGRDDAGLTRLPALDQRNIAAATVSANSARIGDARSIFEDGLLSHVNEVAFRVGGRVGQTVKQFVKLLQQQAR